MLDPILISYYNSRKPGKKYSMGKYKQSSLELVNSRRVGILFGE